MQLTVTIVALLSVMSVSFGGISFGRDSKLDQVIEKQLSELELELQQIRPKNADASPPVPLDDSEPVPSMGDIFLNKKKHENKQTASEDVLFYTDDVTAATAEIESAGGHVGIQFGDSLLLAQVPSTSVTNSYKSASTHIPEGASLATMTYVKAYWKYREAKSMAEPKSQKWTAKTAPKAFARETPYSGEGESPYSATLTGKLSHCTLIASGPGNLALSASEVELVLSEVMTGLNFWVNQARDNGVSLSFREYYGVAQISAPNPTSCPSAPACHDVYAVPTINYFGFSSNDELAEYIKSDAGADGAYLSFFTKYRQIHFAYAYFGGGPSYMQYSNDGWGPDQIDKVFAHETGHVFNAPDEYTNCRCNTQYGEGMCTAKNSNCVSCTASQQPCIMDSNEFVICQYSRKHVGWCD